MKAILALTAALAMALSPLTIQGFNGFRPDQFPIPQIDPPAQPAGYAFSIWLVIYLWLILGTGFGLLNRHSDAEWDRARWPLIVSLVLGAAWIPVAQLSPFWATVMIWVMLIAALRAMVTAGTRDRLWQRTPIALYAGWLTAASCVALALMLAGHGILGGTAAAVLALLLALGLAGVMQLRRPDSPEYAGAVIWALIGVAVSNASPLNATVLGLSLVGILLLGWIALRCTLGRPRSVSP